MVADLALLSLLSKGEANRSQADPHPAVASWGWNPSKVQDDDDSWEVKAFAEDTSNIMGATWPPRSYTCTFCHREFRLAQALGGHMNVHRKDRAKLNRSHLPNPYHNPVLASSSSSSPPSTLVIPTNQEFASNNVVHPQYQLPRANGFSSPSKINARALNPPSSTFFLIPPNAPNVASCPPNTNPRGQLYPGDDIDRPTRRISWDGSYGTIKRVVDSQGGGKEELDLELRLGK
ncbi:hypothetical protein MLD38_038964 [Melastoma candidum]|uniref:Uncharacterized protein n=1 Tax=Melastoma candidum TaxID=119954 RepID=A0ACB9L1A0_9MYRT|nr:hypothetical protein MLD38_038964 [Melastoma candidum]